MTNEEVKTLRKQLGYSQAELAALLDYGSAVRISEFERANNPRPVPRLVAMLMMAMAETGWRPKDCG